MHAERQTDLHLISRSIIARQTCLRGAILIPNLLFSLLSFSIDSTNCIYAGVNAVLHGGNALLHSSNAVLAQLLDVEERVLVTIDYALRARSNWVVEGRGSDPWRLFVAVRHASRVNKVALFRIMHEKDNK